MRGGEHRLPEVRRGSTLMELAMVATLIGVAFTMAAPSILPTEDAAPDRAAHVLMRGIARAQRLAVTKQRNVILTFEFPEQSFTIHVDSDHDGVRGPGETVQTVSLGEGVEYGIGAASARPGDPVPVTFEPGADGRPRVTFRRNGSASEAGGVYLAADGSRLVLVSRATGRGVLHRFDGFDWVPAGR